LILGSHIPQTQTSIDYDSLHVAVNTDHTVYIAANACEKMVPELAKPKRTLSWPAYGLTGSRIIAWLFHLLPPSHSQWSPRCFRHIPQWVSITLSEKNGYKYVV